MSWFNNRKIISKLLILVTFMSTILIVVGVIGIHSLESLDSKAIEMEQSAQEALKSSTLTHSVLMIDQLKFHVVADPSPKVIEETIKAIEKEKKDFENIIDELEKSASPAQYTALEHLRTNYEKYVVTVEETLKVASSIQGFSLSEGQAKVKDSANSSKDESEALNKLVEEYSNSSVENVSKHSEDINTTYKQMAMLMIITLIAGVITGATIGFLMAKFGISKPIGAIVAILQKMAVGNLDVNITGTDRKDEVGDISRTAQIFKDNLIEKNRLDAEQKAAQEQRMVRAKRLEDLIAKFDKEIGQVVATVSSASTELYQTAGNMQKTVTTVSTESGSAASASQQTSGNVQSVASAVEEMSASIKEIASQVSKSSSVVGEAVAKTTSADQTVQMLTDAVSQIGSISEMIQDIAGQINLLALNATIESARAGEAGKGFAVVASEVKNLATQTSKATDEIAKQIENVRNVSGEVANSLKDIQGAVNSMSQYSSGIASAVEEQSAAVREISSNMQQAAKGVENISSNITSITKGALDADAGAGEVLSAAKMLSEQSERLNGEVRTFLAGVRE